MRRLGPKTPPLSEERPLEFDLGESRRGVSVGRRAIHGGARAKEGSRAHAGVPGVHGEAGFREKGQHRRIQQRAEAHAFVDRQVGLAVVMGDYDHPTPFWVVSVADAQALSSVDGSKSATRGRLKIRHQRAEPETHDVYLAACS